MPRDKMEIKQAARKAKKPVPALRRSEVARMTGAIKYRVLARHKWLSDCTITESISECDRYRKFTATILGWRGFEIYCGALYYGVTKKIRAKVEEIRAKIERGDDTIFYQDCHI